MVHTKHIKHILQVERFSSQKSVRTFHFQKVPFAVGFFKKSFCSEKLNTGFFDMLVSLKKKKVFLKNAYYFYNHISLKVFQEKKCSSVFVVGLGQGDGKLSSPGNHAANKGQASFFYCDWPELKSGLSPSLEAIVEFTVITLADCPSHS